MSFVKVNGAELYYEDQGAGPETMVFFHSLLFNCRMFDGQINALRDRYRCVAFDFRGHGKSEVTRDGYDMDTLTADTIALIKELDCAPCHFLGFSTGGFVGLRLAVKRPELLQSLILVDTSADPEPEDNLPKYKLLNLITRWVGPWAVSSRVMPIMFSQSFLSDPAKTHLQKEWRQHFVNNHKVGVTKAVEGVISREGVYGLLSEVGVPTLVLVGENDIATTPDKSERIHDAIPNSRMVTIPNSGHMSPVEEPEAVNAAINDFLANLS